MAQAGVFLCRGLRIAVNGVLLLHGGNATDTEPEIILQNVFFWSPGRFGREDARVSRTTKQVRAATPASKFGSTTTPSGEERERPQLQPGARGGPAAQAP